MADDDKIDRSDSQYKDLLCAIATGLFSQPGARPSAMGDAIVAAADAVFRSVKKADKPPQGVSDGSEGSNEPPTAGPSDSSGQPKVPPDREVPPEDTPMPGDTPKRPNPEHPPEEPKDPNPVKDPDSKTPPPTQPPPVQPPSTQPPPVQPPPVSPPSSGKLK